ncbi:hypothetical protein BGX30_014719, partial [Mortierella sp. GBA39]
MKDVRCKKSIRAERVCITLRRALNEDVRVVIRRLRKQFGKTCPWIAQLSLVAKSTSRDGRTQIVVGDGDTPQGKHVCNNVVKLGSLLGLDEFFEAIDRLGGSISTEKA